MMTWCSLKQKFCGKHLFWRRSFIMNLMKGYFYQKTSTVIAHQRSHFLKTYCVRFFNSLEITPQAQRLLRVADNSPGTEQAWLPQSPPLCHLARRTGTRPTSNKTLRTRNSCSSKTPSSHQHWADHDSANSIYLALWTTKKEENENTFSNAKDLCD